MATELELAAVCVCGHAMRDHRGPDGGCLRGVPSGEASVCPCDKFEEAATT